jgi:hypothetical protein
MNNITGVVDARDRGLRVVQQQELTETPEDFGFPNTLVRINDADEADEPEEENEGDREEIEELPPVPPQNVESPHSLAITKLNDDQIIERISIVADASVSAKNKVIIDKIRIKNEHLARANAIEMEIKSILSNSQSHLSIMKSIEEMSHPYLEDAGCAVTQNQLVVFFKTKRIVTCNTERSRQRDLGKVCFYFSVKDVLSGNYGKIQFGAFSETGMVLPHCHTEALGQVCLGGYANYIMAAIIKGDYNEAFSYFIRFIRNPDVNDGWGKNVLNFPQLTDEQLASYMQSVEQWVKEDREKKLLTNEEIPIAANIAQ